MPDRRIARTSQGAKGSTKGVVSFHPLADDLTRVIVVMEYTPVGPFEQVGAMMRLQLRRGRLDLREFKKFISMQNEETGSWRGEIRHGEVTGQPDQEAQPAAAASLRKGAGLQIMACWAMQASSLCDKPPRWNGHRPEGSAAILPGSGGNAFRPGPVHR